MDDSFTKKLRSAAVAGWWTILIAACVVFVQWLLYLFIMSNQPDWMLNLWGEGVTWSTIRTIWLWSMAVIKISTWLLALVVIWLTLWARLLSRGKS